MHLVRTGAFLRATRCVRLAPCKALVTTPSSRIVGDARQTRNIGRWSSVRLNVLDDLRPVHSDDNTQTASADDASSKCILGKKYPSDNSTNVTDTILGLVGRKLYDDPNHPIAITRALVESVFSGFEFQNYIASDPVVSTKDNFDVLGFPQDHPGRSKTDTYYIDSKTVLRTHSSAHQHEAFKKMKDKRARGYTICADVYRRDSIDRTHFPVFHQMEGALTWKLVEPKRDHETRLSQQGRRHSKIKYDLKVLRKHEMMVSDPGGHHNEETNPIQLAHDPKEAILVAAHLKRSLELLVQVVFEAAQKARPDIQHEKLQIRWVEAYFPFTSPSFELEVFWRGEWLELLGCGVIKQEILNDAGLPDRIGWAWGIGLERLAMILFQIPDIRLFWSQDERFLKQFQQGKITRYTAFSKYPASPRDVSFWISGSPGSASPLAEDDSGAAAAGGDATKASPSETQPAAFHENDFMEVVRDVAGTLAEDVKLVDEFVHPTSGKKSLCYRIVYRSFERTLENDEVNALHTKLLERIKILPLEIR